MAAALRARTGAKAGRNLARYLQGPAPRGRPVRPPVRGVMAAAAGADAVKGLVSKCVAERRGGGGGVPSGTRADLAKPPAPQVEGLPHGGGLGRLLHG